MLPIRPKQPRKQTLSERLGWMLDRAIYPLAPKFATRRMNTRRLAEFTEHRYVQLSARSSTGSSNSFAAARNETHREGRWLVSGLSPDSALDADIQVLQDRCAELYRNNPVANSAIEGRVANEIGVGLLCQPRVRETVDVVSKQDAREFNSQVSEIYRQWSLKGVDRARILTLSQMQKLATRTFATFGEVFLRFGSAPHRGPLSLAVEIISPELIETPPWKNSDVNCKMGIQYNNDGQVIGYWKRFQHPGENRFQKRIDWEWIPRFDEYGLPKMAHVFEPMFPGQSRGIPWLASAINRIKDLDDMHEAELINKQVEACLGIFITSGDDEASDAETLAEINTTETVNGERIEEISPASINYLNNGQDVRTIDPSRPGSTFAPFVEASLRSIAAALNYPYELLAKNFFRTTYSSGRLAMLDGKIGFRMRSQTFKDMGLAPLHELVVHEAIMSGAITVDVFLEYRERPDVFERHQWRGQEHGMLDPHKENQAHAIAIDYGFETKAEILAEKAAEVEDHEEQLEREAMLAVDREVRIAAYRRQLEEEAGLMHGESHVQDDKGYNPTNQENNNPANQRNVDKPQPAESGSE